VRAACAQCHKTEGWKPASFDHAMLSAAERGHCESCHQPPKDVLHRPIKADCGRCHTTQAWKPAIFDHDRLFRLDGDHNVECAVCHAGGEFGRYTCYGCHEHTPANVRAQHREEGIADLNNCVRCHRSARGEGEGD
jgi:formate dehydrogenase maturation protein FdhE